MADLFTDPRPPEPPRVLDLYDDPATVAACCYDAVKSLALRRWAWRNDVIRLAEAIREREQPRTAPTFGNYERSLRGRDARRGAEVRARLAGTGWTVLATAGRVCLCLESETAVMLAKLEGGER